MELIATLKPLDLHSILIKTSNFYYGNGEDREINEQLYSKFITELGTITKKLFEWEMDSRDLIEFEVSLSPQHIDRYDFINIDLDNFKAYLSIGITKMIEYIDSIKEKKAMAQFHTESVIKCSDLLQELKKIELDKTYFVQLKLSESNNFNEYDY